MDVNYYQSPVGWIEIKSDADAITELRFCEKPEQINAMSSQVIRQCIEELEEYFVGKRKIFDVKLKVKGTPFQEEVWRQLLAIPYGTTISYAQLALACGTPKAYRAAGSANGKNSIPIIIPCHRVIASDGGWGGYAYGLTIKKALLELEKQFL